MKNNTWFDIQNKADDETEIFIYDEIGGWGIDAKEFIDEFRAIKTNNITLRINSPGGSVFDGNAIYNVIAQSNKNVEVFIDGLAASMASVIALAGKKVYMPENGFFMIHNPWTVLAGDSKSLRKEADLLDKIRETISGIYQRVTGQTSEVVNEWMDDETWFTGKEAMKAGFITGLIPAIEVSQCAITDDKILENAPDGVLNWIKDKAPVSVGATGNNPTEQENDEMEDVTPKILDEANKDNEIVNALEAERDALKVELATMKAEQEFEAVQDEIYDIVEASALPTPAKEDIVAKFVEANTVEDVQGEVDRIMTLLDLCKAEAPKAEVTDLGLDSASVNDGKKMTNEAANEFIKSFAKKA